MPRAELRKGAIIPLEPLPKDWQEGTALEVEKAEPSSSDADAWAKLMNQLCADSSPADEEVMRCAVEEQKRQAKTQVRREMGL